MNVVIMVTTLLMAFRVHCSRHTTRIDVVSRSHYTYSYTFSPSALIHFQSLRSYVWASLSGVVMGLTPFDVMKREFKCSSPSFQRNCIHIVKYIVKLTWICENGVVAIMIGKSEPWAQRELFHFRNNRVIAYGALVLECELFHCTLSAQWLLIRCDGWENEHRHQNEAVEKKVNQFTV